MSVASLPAKPLPDVKTFPRAAVVRARPSRSVSTRTRKARCSRARLQAEASSHLCVPIQLELPAMPACMEREPPLPRYKRVAPPVHLMADIEATGGYRPVGEGQLLPTLFTHDEAGYRPATDREIFITTHELLKKRFRAGTAITRYPDLLQSFLQAKIGCQQCCVFVALFLTRDERLIQVAELFRGTTSTVDIAPKEVARAAMECAAEAVVCVRTDPRGKAEPTSHDISTAQWLRKLFEVMEMPLVDYVVVGNAMTSLRKKGLIKYDTCWGT